MFLILDSDKSYVFSKGNLTLDYISAHIDSKNYLLEAEEALEKKDKEGLTLKNWNKHPVYKI